MTTWQRRNYEVPDARLVQAEREIYQQYGDMVSIDAKAKSLIKFGKSATLERLAKLYGRRAFPIRSISQHNKQLEFKTCRQH